MKLGRYPLLGFVLACRAALACSSTVESAHVGDGGRALGGSAGAGTGGSSGNVGTGGRVGTGGTSMGGSGGANAGGTGNVGAAGRGSGMGGSGAGTGGGPGNADASVGCTYNGTQYRGGDTFPSTDGCNTCSCTEAGVACTKRACIPEAGVDAPACSDTPVGRLCVRGTSGWTGESIAVGDKLKIMVFPSGCWSSSCTMVGASGCSVSGITPFGAEGHFCLAGTGSSVCTPDCSGGGYAECESTTTLTAGQHTVTLGTLSVTFTVPSTVPFGGQCDGSPF